jgi:hypothetical protein
LKELDLKKGHSFDSAWREERAFESSLSGEVWKEGANPLADTITSGGRKSNAPRLFCGGKQAAR